MKTTISHAATTLALSIIAMGAVTLTGCAGAISASDIQPGVTTVSQVEQTVGRPNMTWKNAQGKVVQAAYTNQPAGYLTFMIYFNDQGVVTRRDQVLNEANFSKLKNGMNGNEVHKILGPERSVDHFANLHQIDWNYGYCTNSDGRQLYSVSFDDRTMLVNGAVTTPDPYWTVGDNTEAYCVPYRTGDSFVK